MKEYYFYLINDSFNNLFKDDHKESFLALFYRKSESLYYEKQFSMFLNSVEKEKIWSALINKYQERKDFIINSNSLSLNNYITGNKEILEINDNYFHLKTDYEISPFLSSLSELYPDLMCIDLNKNKIEVIGLVSFSNIS